METGLAFNVNGKYRLKLCSISVFHFEPFRKDLYSKLLFPFPLLITHQPDWEKKKNPQLQSIFSIFGKKKKKKQFCIIYFNLFTFFSTGITIKVFYFAHYSTVFFTSEWLHQYESFIRISKTNFAKSQNTEANSQASLQLLHE